MQQTVRGLLTLGMVLALGLTAFAQDDMVENPKYKFWANFEVGATSTYQETTKYSGAEKDNLPGGKEVKTITYRLQSVGKDKVVVVTTVVEEEFLGTVESAPTRITYPAKVKKAHLEAVLQELGAKEGKGVKIKVGKDDVDCKVLAGSHKKEGTTVDFHFAYSETVPGGVVRRTRTTKDGGKTVAETTIALQSFNVKPLPKLKPKIILPLPKKS